MITAIILTKNEEQNIVDCLEALSFCSERIVIDDNSTDRTRELARMNGATVVKHALDLDFSGQRNFALSLAREGWIIFIDADERVSPELAEEIKDAVGSGSDYVGFFIQRIDKMFGKTLRFGDVHNLKLLRLARKGVGRWEGKVHERWYVNGKTGILENSLNHEPHKNIKEFLKEINFYTTLRAKELYEKKSNASFFSIIFYPKGKFFCTFFIKRGFLDGTPGFVLSLMMSFHSFLVRGKLYLLNKSK